MTDFRDEIVAGELPCSSGGASVAWIDTRDIAAVAERVHFEPGHAGRIYTLSGPEAYRGHRPDRHRPPASTTTPSGPLTKTH